MRSYDLLKWHCRNIFLVGSGDFWYETHTIGDDKQLQYKIFTIILFSIYVFTTILEIMAAVLGDLPDDEKSDSITFAVSHTIVMIKLYSVISKKELIKKLNKAMVRICHAYEKEKLMVERYRIIKINIVAYFVTVYGSAIFFVFEGLRKMYSGSHFVTVVTYYPAYNDNSKEAVTFRCVTTIILMVMLVSMIITVDAFTMMYLIMYKYKFITLRHYFEDLRERFDRMMENGDCEMAAKVLDNGLIEGIVMHEELLRMSKDIDSAFGIVIALQLCQSSGSTVSLLLQFTLSNQLTFMSSMKIAFFVVALFFLLGLFLCNAGEITYQASLLSDSIFYCGWHACPAPRPPTRSLRSIVLQACAQAQRPLIMKAFKMIELTYGTFLLVVRSTYSVFALVYAQNKN